MLFKEIPKPKSRIIIGYNDNIVIYVNHHFNWFQKKMISFCFGLKVEDEKEE